jgi:Abortive infection alpha
LAKRLERIPPENRATPNPRIAVPAIQALAYSFDEKIIREMFANLLEADSKVDRKGKAHPAFVQLIKQMTPLDAKVLWV